METEIIKDKSYQLLKGTKRSKYDDIPFGENDETIRCGHCDEFNALVDMVVMEDGSEKRVGIVAMAKRNGEPGLFGSFSAKELRVLSAAFIKMAENIESAPQTNEFGHA